MGNNNGKMGLPNISIGGSNLSRDVERKLQEASENGFDNHQLVLTNMNIDDKMIPDLLEWCKKYQKDIESLNLSSNKLTSNGATTLFNNLKESKSTIRKLLLTGNEIDDECMKSLGEYIQENGQIKHVNVGNNKITDWGVETLSTHVIGNKSLKSLGLYRNKGITAKSTPLLIDIINKSSLEDVNVTRTSILEKNILLIPLVTNVFRHGVSLDLSWKEINDEDLLKICEVMKKYGCDRLKSIDLGSNGITSKSAITFFDTLNIQKARLETLNLGSNFIDDECMSSLGEYLERNEYLQDLKLDHNKITDRGIETLEPYVSGNIHLKSLDISWNPGVTDKSAGVLTDISLRSGISDVNMANTAVSDEKQEEIKKPLEVALEEREIPIFSNTKSAAKSIMNQPL